MNDVEAEHELCPICLEKMESGDSVKQRETKCVSVGDETAGTGFVPIEGSTDAVEQMETTLSVYVAAPVHQTDIVVQTKCHHRFHRGCWLQYYKTPKHSICPMCRAEDCAPDDYPDPHQYSVNIEYNSEQQEWELMVLENFMFDFGGNASLRRDMVLSRIFSALKHAWIHQNTDRVVIRGNPILLYEIYDSRNYFADYLRTMELQFVVLDQFSSFLENSEVADGVTTIHIPTSSVEMAVVVELDDY